MATWRNAICCRVSTWWTVVSGYMSAERLVQSEKQDVGLIGPVREERSWQAEETEGYDIASFVIDWEAEQVRCPQGHVSQKWGLNNKYDTPMIHVRFSAKHCNHCPVRGRCTRAKIVARSITFHQQP